MPCLIAAQMTADDPQLTDVPTILWAKHKYDVGLMKNAAPLIVTPKSDYRPCKKQYPLSPKAIEGVTPVFESLIDQGIVVACPDSPCRTPIFPVKKAPQDLANAFFCIPVHKDSQFWFAFTFKERSWTWTRAPMGYCDSP